MPAALRPRYIRLTNLKSSAPPNFRDGQLTPIGVCIVQDPDLLTHGIMMWPQAPCHRFADYGHRGLRIRLCGGGVAALLYGNLQQGEVPRRHMVVPRAQGHFTLSVRNRYIWQHAIERCRSRGGNCLDYRFGRKPVYNLCPELLPNSQYDHILRFESNVGVLQNISSAKERAGASEKDYTYRDLPYDKRIAQPHWSNIAGELAPSCQQRIGACCLNCGRQAEADSRYESG